MLKLFNTKIEGERDKRKKRKKKKNRKREIDKHNK
jgi:hypothetical protein